jgi:hypothetical protein
MLLLIGGSLCSLEAVLNLQTWLLVQAVSPKNHILDIASQGSSGCNCDLDYKRTLAEKIESILVLILAGLVNRWQMKLSIGHVHSKDPVILFLNLSIQ